MAIGRVALTTQPTAINQDIKALYTNDYLLPKYLFYLLHISRQQLEAVSIGSTVKGLSLKQLLSLPISVPLLSVQHQIITILDTINEQIQHTERLITKLKLQRAGLVHKLLTCGIDEHGQLRDPGAHPEQFHVTTSGKVPRKWEVPSIGSLAIHIGSGSTPTGGSKVYQSEGIMFIRSQNVTFEGLLLDDIAFIDMQTHKRMKRSEVFTHDVLLNITGASIGRCCLLLPNINLANVNQHVCAIRLPNPTYEDSLFLSTVLASYIGQSQINRLNAGGNREGLNYKQLRSFIIPWPPKEERISIAKRIDAYNNLVRTEEMYLSKLKLYKNGLMHDLLTGKVRVFGKQEELEKRAMPGN